MRVCNTEPRWFLESTITRIVVISVLGLVLIMAEPARADIGAVSPDSVEVVQGGIATIEISISSGGGWVTAVSPPQSGLVIAVLPNLLGEWEWTATIETLLTPPGDYQIVFEQRAGLLGGGALVGSATVDLTVNPLLAPATTTTTTTTTTSTTTTSTTTTTTTPTITTTSTPTTTTIDQPIISTPPSTTSTLAPATTTSTTIDELGGVTPGGLPSTSTTTTSPSTTTSSTLGDEDPAGASPGEPPDESGLPPRPEEVEVIAAPPNDPVRSFLDPILPAAVSDVIASPFHVIGSIVSGVLDTGRNVALSLLVLVVYAAYLLRRWRIPPTDQAEGVR